MSQILRFQALLAFMVLSGGLAKAQTLAHAADMVPAPATSVPLTSRPVPAAPVVYPDSVYVNPEVRPQFAGGDKAFAEYLKKSIRYPQQALQRRVSGRVFVNFVLNAEGRVQDAHVVSGPGSGLNDEALRLVWLMPPWQPARVNGQPVRVACTVPISFSSDR
ncbi:MAG TPA: energy transducer TonB [Hymenobacter sp.]|jgi:protein TonB